MTDGEGKNANGRRGICWEASKPIGFDITTPDTEMAAMESDGSTRRPEEALNAIKPYGIADATALFSQQTSIMNGLWAVYVAATFAIAGFGISVAGMLPSTALAVTLGFRVFALGHLSLLRQTLRILSVIRSDISQAIEFNSPKIFNETLNRVVRTNNPLWISTSAHLIIDVCATAALWSRL
jgi:hypothetical protein